MAKNQTIQHKRSSVATNKPSTAQVEIGELAINFADKSLYTRTPTNTIIELERDVIKSTTQPASPTDGDMWYDTANDSLYLWDGAAWTSLMNAGKSVSPANTTASPTWSGGAGTGASPYVFTITASPGAKSHVTTVTVTGLAPGQFVPISDSNAASNGGRFTVTNNLADDSGVLIFNIIFNDVPSSTNGTSYVANLQVGTGTVYITVTANIVSVGPTFPQSVSFPTNTASVTTSWTAANDTLTSTGDLRISLDGVTFGTGPLAITTGATLYTKWTGGPGTGLGIDGANGTTITGAVVSSNGASTSSSLTIDKTPATITFTAATGAALSTAVDSNTVTLAGVNSYVYLTSANTMIASVDGVTPITVPASGTTLYAINGQTLQVRQTSSATISTTTTVTITAGGTTAGFSVTTAGAGTINDPSITAPIGGSTGISVTPTLTSSAYAVTGIVGTHLNSDWQIFTNSTMTGAAAFSSMASTTNLTTWSPTGLSGLTQYWAQVRYRSNDGTAIVSSYSPIVTWTTAAVAGQNWTNQTSLSTGTWNTTVQNVNDIAWNGSTYVAAGGRTAARVATSTDGINWVDQTTNLVTAGWTSGSGVYSAVRTGTNTFIVGGASGKIATSPDGVTWTNQTSLSGTAWGGSSVNTIVYNGSNLYVAGGPLGKIATSSNGTSWTYQTGLSGTAWGTVDAVTDIVYNGSNLYVAVGHNGKVATSPTGTTWTNQTSLSSGTWTNSIDVLTIAWNGTNQYVLGGEGGRIATSSNGTNWTFQTGLQSTAWGTSAGVNDIIWTGSQYLAVGDTGRAATSTDGVNWTYQAGLSATAYGAGNSNTAVWNGTQYVVGGNSGKIATSP